MPFWPKIPQKWGFGAKNDHFWHVLAQVVSFETPEIHRKDKKKSQNLSKMFFHAYKKCLKTVADGKNNCFPEFSTDVKRSRF